MGLRESLRDFITMQDMTSAGAKATGELATAVQDQKKQMGLRELAQQLPGAIQSGDLSQVAGDAYGLGDPSIFKAVMDQRAAQTKASADGGDAPMTPEQISSTFAVPLEKAQIMAMAPTRSQQLREISTYGSQADRDLDRNLREGTQYELTRDRFAKSIESNIKKYRENKEAFEKLQNLDPRTNIGFWPKVSTIIKKVGMDSGALSNEDMERFIIATGQRTMTQARQWLSEMDPSKTNVDEKTIQAVEDVIEKMRAFSDKQYNERGLEELKKQVRVRGNRIEDDHVKEQALQFGAVANKKDDGKWEYGKELSLGKEKVDMDSKGMQDVYSLIKRIPPNMQAMAIKRIQKLEGEGKPIPDSYMEELNRLGGVK